MSSRKRSNSSAGKTHRTRGTRRAAHPAATDHRRPAHRLRTARASGVAGLPLAHIPMETIPLKKIQHLIAAPDDPRRAGD
jgi:hypothetical protein